MGLLLLFHKIKIYKKKFTLIIMNFTFCNVSCLSLEKIREETKNQQIKKEAQRLININVMDMDGYVK